MKKFSTILFFGLIALFVFSFNAQAQESEMPEDPKKNPKVWAKLKSDPSDIVLWESYMGKKWAAMSKSEQEEVSILRQELLLRKISEREIVITNDEKMLDEDELIIEELKVSDLSNAETLIMMEQEEITELKSNISENFVILEDLYREVFSEFGLTYQTFQEAHPDRKYSKAKWVEEQDSKILELKKKRVAELRSQIKVKK